MNIEIRRTKRKTMVLEVTPEAEVLVRAPYRMPETEINRFIENKRDWIEKSVEKARERKREHSSLERLTQEDIYNLAVQAQAVIPPMAACYAKQIGVTYGKITIRNQKSRWGSCSAKGNLNINCLLMRAPKEVQEYIVVHELCHRKEMNHSHRFWEEVEKILPDYKERKSWLKEHGEKLIYSKRR